MATRSSELGEFLWARRARVDVAQVGLPQTARRRVRARRREEVAAPAGLSAGYYARLEQGHRLTASHEVLDAWCACPARSSAPRRTPSSSRPRMRGLLDELGPRARDPPRPRHRGARRRQVVCLVFADYPGMQARNRVIVRWPLGHESARVRHDDWAGIGEEIVGMLRLALALALGRDPEDPRAPRVVAELSATSRCSAACGRPPGGGGPHSTKRVFHSVGVERSSAPSTWPPQPHSGRNFSRTSHPGTGTTQRSTNARPGETCRRADLRGDCGLWPHWDRVHPR
ncbi:hypothetical protein AB0F91_35875 [Amycolatopsis sp. NPDC023774]|uniref:MmyB family transcriptional regulator n=1 Tax=Amycolatopsis sp. NPDC023774 TaxID=3155015 RepID=UPI0033C3BBA1